MAKLGRYVRAWVEKNLLRDKKWSSKPLVGMNGMPITHVARSLGVLECSYRN